jgi:hypothetical protein
MNIIYEAVVGSQLKGNATAQSDTDTMGIFIAKNEELGGFDWTNSNDMVSDASPIGDDHTYYELRKFFRLASKSSPVLLPLIASHLIRKSTSFGLEVITVAREDLISQEWLRKTGNYTVGKIRVYKEKETKKDLFEAYYLGEMAARWLHYGYAWGCLDGGAPYFSGVDYESFLAFETEKQEKLVYDLADYLLTMKASDKLKETPDLTRATKFLSHARNNFG